VRSESRHEVDPLPNWTLHDPAANSETLMARAGVRPDISERVLGHVMTGVEELMTGIPTRKKSGKLSKKLAAMIERNFEPVAVKRCDNRRTSHSSLSQRRQTHEDHNIDGTANILDYEALMMSG